MVKTNSLGTRRPNSSNSMSEIMVGMLCNTKCLARTRNGCPKMVYWCGNPINSMSSMAPMSSIREPLSCTTARYGQTERYSYRNARVHWLLAINMWPWHDRSIYQFTHAYFAILDRCERGIGNTSHKRIHCRVAIMQGVLATEYSRSICTFILAQWRTSGRAPTGWPIYMLVQQTFVLQLFSASQIMSMRGIS